MGGAVRDGLSKVELKRRGDFWHVEITPRDREEEGLGLINAERDVTAVDQAEHARRRPRKAPVVERR